MRLLMIGDVVGRPGRRAVRTLLPRLRHEYSIDLVIANGENAAGGFGLTVETAEELLACGVDVITSGNHIWDRREIIAHLDCELPILRPMNYPEGVPGRGYLLIGETVVVNAMGRVFMTPLPCPFRAMDALLEEWAERKPGVVIVDFHAEATSEKQAFAWYLDGRVGAVLGTHTHVATADARILPRGTAFVTDVGMTAPRDSVIGNDPEVVMERFLKQIPQRLTVPGGPVIFNSVLVEFDGQGRALSIQRVDLLT